MSEGDSVVRQRFSPVTALFLIVLVDVLGYTIILPLLPFFAGRFGASPAVVGALIASFAVCQLISGPFLGRLSDRMGRKPLLVVSQVGTLAGFLILAYAPSLAWVFVGRILDGLTAGNISLAQAAISDVTRPEERGKAFGKIGVAFGIGFLIGPALSGYLARYGYHVPILAGACLSGLSIVATSVLLPSGLPPARAPSPGASSSPGASPSPPAAPARPPIKIIDVASFARFFKVPALRLRLGQFFLFILSFSMWTSGFALFAEAQLRFGGQPFGPSEVAWVLAYGGLIGILLQGFLMGRLVARFGEARLVTCGLFSMVVGYAILGEATGYPVALAAATFSGVGHGLTRPSLTSLVSRAADRTEQGAVLGVNQSLQSLAQIIAPLVGGMLIEHHLTAPWAWAASAFALCALLAERVAA
jgi:MFS family permease